MGVLVLRVRDGLVGSSGNERFRRVSEKGEIGVGDAPGE